MSDRETVQQVYIRICRDSGFKMTWDNAARLAAKALRISPLEVWLAMPCMDVMQQIATGDHPAAHRIARKAPA